MGLMEVSKSNINIFIRGLDRDVQFEFGYTIYKRRL